MWEQVYHPEQEVLPDRSEKGKRILVVDDTRFFQHLVSEYLRAEGHVVDVANNGSEGLAKLQKQRFDVVVCDIEMPVMDGLTLARRVREDPRLAPIPLLALTTLNTPQSRADAMDSGFDAYEVKLDRATLVASVGDLLSRGRSTGAADVGGRANE
jgi:two-component system chemotaxis sensor kinase CheA